MIEIKIAPYPEERELDVLKKINVILEKELLKTTKTLILRNDELLKAKDALRWREYPQEKPEEGQMFVALRAKKTCLGIWKMGNPCKTHGSTTERHFIINDIKGKFYWLPIPPLEEK